MATTTITLDTEVRDRLKALSGPGVNYSEALTRLMDKIQLDEFWEEFKRDMDDPKYPWEEIPWDDPVWDD